MEEENSNNLSKLIAKLEMTTSDKKKINEIKRLIKEGNLELTMKKIEEIFAEKNDYEEETVEEKNDEEIKFPKELEAEDLEYIYIGLLLNHPKFIAKYYFLFDDCLFENPLKDPNMHQKYLKKILTFPKILLVFISLNKK